MSWAPCSPSFNQSFLIAVNSFFREREPATLTGFEFKKHHGILLVSKNDL